MRLLTGNDLPTGDVVSMDPGVRRDDEGEGWNDEG